jgi:hypothetical protein
LTEELVKLRAKEKEIKKSFPEELACCAKDCFEDAAWVRSAQFGGDCPFCDMHAKQEEDFGKQDSSYFFWQTISEFHEAYERRQRDEAVEANRKILN